jgi:V8-like Glu-specific endopeptidase
MNILGKFNSSSESLEDLLRKCTVKISLPGTYGWGTGFFVAPGLILTCNHVVNGKPGQADIKAEIGTKLQISWLEKDILIEAEVAESYANPYDLALLKFDPPRKLKLPYVWLNQEVNSRDRLYLFGYPDDEGFPNGCPVTVDCEGITGGESYIKFSLGQIRPGMSGSALLNQETGMICGIVKSTRDQTSDLGGGAIQSTEILRLFPELKDLQRQFHYTDHIHNWKKLARKQAARGIHKLNEKPKNEQYLLLQTSHEVFKRLSKSLYDEILISLDMELQPSEVIGSYDSDIIIGSKPGYNLPPEASIVDIFNHPEIAGKLLILGEPGSGKTTQLLKLIDFLIDQAELNIDYPIPAA